VTPAGRRFPFEGTPPPTVVGGGGRLDGGLSPRGRVLKADETSWAVVAKPRSPRAGVHHRGGGARPATQFCRASERGGWSGWSTTRRTTTTLPVGPGPVAAAAPARRGVGRDTVAQPSMSWAIARRCHRVEVAPPGPEVAGHVGIDTGCGRSRGIARDR
jgi:hypothetical protein